MAYLDDMPGLKDLYEKLMAQKEAIESVLDPIRKEYDALQLEMTPMLDRQRALGEQIKTVTSERQLGAICNQLSAIARAAGGRSTSQSVTPDSMNVQTVVPVVTAGMDASTVPQE